MVKFVSVEIEGLAAFLHKERIIFTFENGKANDVNYEDYH